MSSRINRENLINKSRQNRQKYDQLKKMIFQMYEQYYYQKKEKKDIQQLIQSLTQSIQNLNVTLFCGLFCQKIIYKQNLLHNQKNQIKNSQKLSKQKEKSFDSRQKSFDNTNPFKKKNTSFIVQNQNIDTSNSIIKISNNKKQTINQKRQTINQKTNLLNSLYQSKEQKFKNSNYFHLLIQIFYMHWKTTNQDQKQTFINIFISHIGADFQAYLNIYQNIFIYNFFHIQLEQWNRFQQSLTNYILFSNSQIDWKSLVKDKQSSLRQKLGQKTITQNQNKWKHILILTKTQEIILYKQQLLNTIKQIVKIKSYQDFIHEECLKNVKNIIVKEFKEKTKFAYYKQINNGQQYMIQQKTKGMLQKITQENIGKQQKYQPLHQIKSNKNNQIQDINSIQLYRQDFQYQWPFTPQNYKQITKIYIAVLNSDHCQFITLGICKLKNNLQNIGVPIKEYKDVERFIKTIVVAIDNISLQLTQEVKNENSKKLKKELQNNKSKWEANKKKLKDSSSTKNKTVNQTKASQSDIPTQKQFNIETDESQQYTYHINQYLSISISKTQIHQSYQILLNQFQVNSDKVSIQPRYIIKIIFKLGNRMNTYYTKDKSNNVVSYVRDQKTRKIRQLKTDQYINLQKKRWRQYTKNFNTDKFFQLEYVQLKL